MSANKKTIGQLVTEAEEDCRKAGYQPRKWKFVIFNGRGHFEVSVEASNGADAVQSALSVAEENWPGMGLGIQSVVITGADRVAITDENAGEVEAILDAAIDRELSELNEIKPAPPRAPAIGDHYRFSYRGIKLDPYRIFCVYRITHPAQQHAIKKLLRAGQSVKSTREDVKETIATLSRWLEMMNEDEEGAV